MIDFFVWFCVAMFIAQFVAAYKNIDKVEVPNTDQNSDMYMYFVLSDHE